MRVRTVLVLAPLLALAGCGGSGGKGDAGASPPVSAVAAPASPPAEPAPSAPAAAPSSPVGGVQPGGTAGRKPAGMWRGPRNQDGSTPTIWVQPDGSVQVESGGFNCSGRATRFGSDTNFRIRVTQCPAPIPPMAAKLSDDGETLTVTNGGKQETWRLMERPR